MTDSFLQSLAVWALLHEAADDGWKAAVARGAATAAGTAVAEASAGAGAAGTAGGDGATGGGPDAFVDALATLVAEEKERLKARLAAGSASGPVNGPASVVSAEDVAELRFELAEIRARLESMEVALDTLLRRSEPAARA